MTDLMIRYEPIKKGNKVIKINFFIEQKNPIERMLAGTTANDRLNNITKK